ncbi:hypothetical protein D3C79_1065180 [compost metagenome]
MHIGEVEEDSTAVFQLDQASIGVADGEEANDVHAISYRKNQHSRAGAPPIRLEKSTTGSDSIS